MWPWASAPWLAWLVAGAVLLALGGAALWLLRRRLPPLFLSPQRARAASAADPNSEAQDIDFMRYAYTLEVSQVELYGEQIERLEAEGGDEHLIAALRRVRQMEQGHAERLQGELERRGQPVPRAERSAGHLLGHAIALAEAPLTVDRLLRYNLWIEGKAIDHYLACLRLTRDSRLRALFLENLVEEEFHAAWAAEYESQLAEGGERDRGPLEPRPRR